MDLSTRYLGFDLPHPFMPGASLLVDEMETSEGTGQPPTKKKAGPPHQLQSR